MRRRELLALLGGAAAACPLAARAQQAAIPVVAFIRSNSLAGAERHFEAFGRGLAEAGFADKKNVAIEYYFAEGRPERLPEIIGGLVRRRVAVICTPSNVSTLAAKAATAEVPIVFVFGIDPVRMGLVASINRPGGNATGVSFLTSALVPKSVDVLRELLPSVKSFAALVNPANPNAESHVGDLRATARDFDLKLFIFEAREVGALEATFSAMVQHGPDALLVTSDPVFDAYASRVVELAARHAIPAVYPWRDFVDLGGLLSYGNSLTGAIRQAGIYAGRILRGDKPADLPVWIPTTFELVINLKTAKTLALAVQPALLARADEVIE